MNMLDDGLNSGAFPCMKQNPDDYTVPTSTTDSRGGYEQLVSVLSARSYFYNYTIYGASLEKNMKPQSPPIGSSSVKKLVSSQNSLLEKVTI